MQWLKGHGSDPDLWHMLAGRYSDDLLVSYEWIVAHADCDAGTAAMIFHVWNPDQYLSCSSAEIGALRNRSVEFRIIEIAARRWVDTVLSVRQR